MTLIKLVTPLMVRIWNENTDWLNKRELGEEVGLGEFVGYLEDFVEELEREAGM